MKTVHFGVSNIGRGFIGQLLSQSGHEVCFVTRKCSEGESFAGETSVRRRVGE